MQLINFVSKFILLLYLYTFTIQSCNEPRQLIVNFLLLQRRRVDERKLGTVLLGVDQTNLRFWLFHVMHFNSAFIRHFMYT